MYPVSDRFKKAIKVSHVMRSRVDIVAPDSTVLKEGLSVERGNVSIDGANAVRRRASTDLIDATGEYTPGDYEDMLHPLAHNEVRLYRGIRFSDGTEELVPLGVFDSERVTITDSGESVHLSLDLYDWTVKVQRARLLAPYIVPAGTNYGTAIRDLIESRVPGLKYNFSYIDAVTPELRFGSDDDNAGGGDPWKYAQEMAESVAHQLYFDVNKVVILKPIPDVRNDPVVWEYEEGPKAMVLSIQKQVSKAETYNHVIVMGENTDNDEPVSAEAWDDDPDSPTWLDGPFGDVPTWLRSPYVTTESQAQQLADAKLNQVLGTQEQLTTTNIANPAHEVGDVIKVKRDRIKVDSRFVIDKMNANLSPMQSMNLTMRERRH